MVSFWQQSSSWFKDNYLLTILRDEREMERGSGGRGEKEWGERKRKTERGERDEEKREGEREEEERENTSK